VPIDQAGGAKKMQDEKGTPLLNRKGSRMEPRERYLNERFLGLIKKLSAIPLMGMGRNKKNQKIREGKDSTGRISP